MTPEQWADKLRNDLAFAAPEMQRMHMIRRFEEAMEDSPPRETTRDEAALREAIERIAASDERTGLVVVDVDRAVVALAAALGRSGSET